VFILLLYVCYWVPWISSSVRWAIYIPAVPVALAFCLASYVLKRDPGGPPVAVGNQEVRRPSEGELELDLARKRDTRKLVVASAEVATKVRRVTYKEDAYADVETLRSESRSYRRVNNVLQGILIVGSLVATGVSSLVASDAGALWWVTPTITLIVGISSGFMGYYKYKERSFYLQQTADAIESEWEAVEVGVGRYKNIKGEEERLAEFVEEVHRLKSEQKKRQQNLEQPPEARDPNEG
jgi:hypothetical protein